MTADGAVWLRTAEEQVAAITRARYVCRFFSSIFVVVIIVIVVIVVIAVIKVNVSIVQRFVEKWVVVVFRLLHDRDYSCLLLVDGGVSVVTLVNSGGSGSAVRNSVARCILVVRTCGAVASNAGRPLANTDLSVQRASFAVFDNWSWAVRRTSSAISRFAIISTHIAAESSGFECICCIVTARARACLAIDARCCNYENRQY